MPGSGVAFFRALDTCYLPEGPVGMRVLGSWGRKSQRPRGGGDSALGEGGQGHGKGLLEALSSYISDSPLGSEGWGPRTSRPCLPPALARLGPRHHVSRFQVFSGAAAPTPWPHTAQPAGLVQAWGSQHLPSACGRPRQRESLEPRALGRWVTKPRVVP